MGRGREHAIQIVQKMTGSLKPSPSAKQLISLFPRRTFFMTQSLGYFLDENDVEGLPSGAAV